MVQELERNETGEAVEINGRKVPPNEILDDIEDPKSWVKANPVICSYPEGVAYLKRKIEEAKEAPEKMRNLLTKHMNVWVNMREAGYMVPAKWAACFGDIPNLEGQRCNIGLDLSAKIDLTSLAFEFKIDDLYYVIGHSFMPADTFEERRRSDKVPYELWEKQGWLTVLPGAVVDYRAVVAYAKERTEAEGWRRGEWCIDPWGAAQISADLVEDGEDVVEIVQGIKTLSEPTKDFRDMVLQKRVVHEGSPVIAWAMGNAIADEVDRNKNIILNKKKSRERIDPAASIINAHVRTMVIEPERAPRIRFFG